MNSLLARTRAVACLVLLASLAPAVGQTTAEKQQAQQLYQQAVNLERQNLLLPAVEAMLQALQLWPKNDVYQGYTAVLELKTDKAASALEHAEEAARLNPRRLGYQ